MSISEEDNNNYKSDLKLKLLKLINDSNYPISLNEMYLKLNNDEDNNKEYIIKKENIENSILELVKDKLM